MVSIKEYSKKPLTYWKTVKVQTTRPLSNGYCEIPVGTICEVTDKRSGFSLKTDACKTCGVKVFISKVPSEAVKIIEARK